MLCRFLPVLYNLRPSSLAPTLYSKNRTTTPLTSTMAHLENTDYAPGYHKVSSDEPSRERSHSYSQERTMGLVEKGDVPSSAPTDSNKLTTPVFLAVLALSATYTGSHPPPSLSRQHHSLTPAFHRLQPIRLLPRRGLRLHGPRPTYRRQQSMAAHRQLPGFRLYRTVRGLPLGYLWTSKSVDYWECWEYPGRSAYGSLQWVRVGDCRVDREWDWWSDWRVDCDCCVSNSLSS